MYYDLTLRIFVTHCGDKMAGMVFGETLESSLPSDIGHSGLVASEIEEVLTH